MLLFDPIGRWGKLRHEFFFWIPEWDPTPLDIVVKDPTETAHGDEQE